jgi:hypothetical protein
MSSKKFSFVLMVTVMSLLALLSMGDPNAIGADRIRETDIETIMSEAESRGLSVVYNTKGRSLPLIFNPLSKLITAVKPTTVLKAGLIYSGGLYLLTLLFPAKFGIIARSGRTVNPFDFNYEYITRSLSEATESIAGFLQIPEPDCRYRAVCETATYIATKVPLINEWAKKVSGAFFLNLANPYSKAWINGMMQIDCTTTYVQCVESPYKTIMNRFITRK